MSAFADAVLAKDLDALRATLHPDVEFRSPAVFAPYRGVDATMHVLTAVMSVFEQFRYVGEYAGADGQVLRFTAEVAQRSVEGVDVLRLDADGLVTELTVLIRPLSGLNAVVAAMGRALGGS